MAKSKEEIFESIRTMRDVWKKKDIDDGGLSEILHKTVEEQGVEKAKEWFLLMIQMYKADPNIEPKKKDQLIDILNSYINLIL